MTGRHPDTRNWVKMQDSVQRSPQYSVSSRAPRPIAAFLARDPEPGFAETTSLRQYVAPNSNLPASTSSAGLATVNGSHVQRLSQPEFAKKAPPQ